MSLVAGRETTEIGSSFGFSQIELTLDVLTDTGCHDVSAEVTRLGEDDYCVIWADLEAVRSLGLPSTQLGTLVKRFKAEFRWLEWERESMPPLEAVAPIRSHGRDQTVSEVA